MRQAEAALTEPCDDQLLAYLSGELTSEERRVFKARLASEPALRCELEAWRSLAQARQRVFNAEGALERERVLMVQLDALHREKGSTTPIAADPPARVDV